MAGWTYIDKEDLLENITVREHYNENNVLRMRELIAHEGYAIYDTTYDWGVDEEGNPLPPMYSYSVSLPLSVNINNYEAVLITPDMDVSGMPEEPTETT